jgi:hypothetical protein
LTIAETHDRLDFLLNKEISGYITPENKDIALDLAQIQEFSMLLPAPRTLQFSSDLNPFHKWITFTSSAYNPSTARYGTGTSGILILPDDYEYLQVAYTDDYNEIDVLIDTELPSRLISSLIAPSATYPVCIESGEGASGDTLNSQDIEGKKKLQFYPNNVGHDGILWYFRRPVKPVFAYTASANTITQEEEDSVDMEWNDIAMGRIIERAKMILLEHLQASVNA